MYTSLAQSSSIIGHCHIGKAHTSQKLGSQSENVKESGLSSPEGKKGRFLPCRFSYFDRTIGSSDLGDISTWLSQFLTNGNSKQHTIFEMSDAPPQLQDSYSLAAQIQQQLDGILTHYR